MGMTDSEKRERVIKELECIRDWSQFAVNKRWLVAGATEKMVKYAEDALKLLKAQEPRLITEEDFEDKTMVDDACGLPVWVEYRRDDEWGEYLEDTSDEWAIVYKQHYRTDKSMRYWTSRPTDEQRENTPWDTI